MLFAYGASTDIECRFQIFPKTDFFAEFWDIGKDTTPYNFASLSL